MQLFCIFIAALIASVSHAALITNRTDNDNAAATVNGSIGTSEYGPANAYSFTGGGSGFGGQLGPATLYVNSDASTLYLGFSGLGIPADSNQYVVYFHTRGGGYQPNGVDMSDTSDDGRRNTARLSLSGEEAVTFSDGGSSNRPDFALTFCNAGVVTGGFSALFELTGAGTNLGLVSHTAAGLGTPTPEFSVSLASLGIGNGSNVDLAAFEISATGFMADEGLPATGLGGNPGFNAGNTNLFPDFHRFTVATIGPPEPPTSRVNNTTLRMPQTAPTSSNLPYTTTNAFPGVVFTNPVSIAVPPGETNRLFVVERDGILVVITNLSNPSRSVFLDIKNRVTAGGEQGLLALAFHPGYATNRYFFVYYTASGSGASNRITRFQVTSTNASAADPSSETIFISQHDDAGNHNGCDLHFGPDGYLYASLGDEGSFNDLLNNSQRIDQDFFAGMIRIDVDKKPGNLAPNFHAAIGAVTNYSIPNDNPFIGFTQFNGSAVNSNNVRTEFYAVGLRNPFRFSFDPVSGYLYCGDVGQDAREEVDIIAKGGNYGWKWREGFIATSGVGSPPSGFTNAIDPIIDYGHGGGTNQGYSVIGGFVYRGDRFPELVGRYIFGDNAIGNIWSLTNNGTNATSFGRLTGDADLASFFPDPRNGDILISDLGDGMIKRLAYGAISTNFPQTLADTGVFTNLLTLGTSTGIVPFEINVPFWSDNAIKSRWFCVPSTNQMISFDAESAWTFPTGTVWVKHFDLLLTNGVTSSARRIETRILVKNGDVNGGYGVTYRWGQSVTNATLIGDGGLDEDILINNAGSITTQTWHYPSRSECLSCHKTTPGFALGFNTPQLNKDKDYGSTTTNQIRVFDAACYFTTNVTGFHSLPALAHPTNAAHSVEYRARSYLQANCAQCHFPGPANWDARVSTSLSQANIINGSLNNDFGDPANKEVVPGNTTNSMMLTRISTRGSGKMPPLGSNLVDTQGVALITAWIGELTNYQSYAQWWAQHYGSTNNPAGAGTNDFDGDGNVNDLEYLTGTNPTNPVGDAWGYGFSLTSGVPQISFLRVANRGFDVQYITNLLENTWQSLDVEGNEPFFGATDQDVVIDDPATNAAQRYYRINVYEP